jgi:23S rRNA pseudouridine1911/1915/1917 synthase
MPTYNLILSAMTRGWRLDRALAHAVPQLSRARIQSLIGSGAVSLNGCVLRARALVVQGGEAVQICVPEPTMPAARAQDIALKLVYEDDHLLVVDKPAGLVVHPAAGNLEGTLVNALLYHCAGRLSGIGGVARPGIVHRIDKDTSGLLVVAKTDPAHEGLSRQFAKHSIEREYRAVVNGVPKAVQGTIHAPLGRSTQNRKKMVVVAPGLGKDACTHYQLLQAFEGCALVGCRLETGRTHQIRVHMASLGHALLGDPVYGSPSKNKLLRQLLADLHFMRQALHANILGFIHPIEKRALRFESPLPEDLQQLLNALNHNPPC